MVSPDISGRTKLVGIIGHPLTYTISPRIHNAAFRRLGLDWRYVPLVVRPEDLKEAVAGLRALGFHGFNVTMPHKNSVMGLLDELDGSAVRAGAVNTVAITRRLLVGHNTDGAGFLAALAGHGFEPAGRRVIIIGAGGAAAAVASSLAESGITSIAIINRTKSRALALERHLHSISPGLPLKVLTLGESLADTFREGDLVINATPLGMDQFAGEIPIPDTLLGPRHLVFDLAYQSDETRLLLAARQRGASTIGGLDMLVHQAAIAFEIWTGVRPPVAVMKAAAQQTARRANESTEGHARGADRATSGKRRSHLRGTAGQGEDRSQGQSARPPAG